MPIKDGRRRQNRHSTATMLGYDVALIFAMQSES